MADVDETKWPPGTVRIELLQRKKGEDIVLQPPPTDDPNDPLNWPTWRKHINFGLSVFYAFMVYAFIDAATPTWAPMNEQLGFSYDILNDSYAIGCGTLAFGALLLIPFALKYGRRPVYIISTAVQTALCIWSARLMTVADLLLINALSCLVGAISEVICNMTIADMYFVHQRGSMSGTFVWVSSAGASLAPVAAGYITTSQGWRWVWWWCTIFFAGMFIAFVFCYEETKFSNTNGAQSTQSATRDMFQPVSPQKRGREKSIAIAKDSSVGSDIEAGEVRNVDITKVHVNLSIPAKTYVQRLSLWSSSPGKLSHVVRHAYQPMQVLFTIPAVFYFALVYGVMNAWSTVIVTVLSSWMADPPYNFNPSQIGLMSLPSFIGTTAGTLIAGPLSDWFILYMARKNGGIYEPEMRLWVMLPFIPAVPAGALLFGFGLANGSSVYLLAFAYALTNFGTGPIQSIALTYITDSYTEIVADSIMGVTFTRNTISTIFVFAMSPWIAKLGMKTVFVIITVIGSAVLLFNVAFIMYGKRWRVWTAPRYRYYAERQFEARPV